MGLGYEKGARLLTAEERARGMASRSKPMPPRWGGHPWYFGDMFGGAAADNNGSNASSNTSSNSSNGSNGSDGSNSSSTTAAADFEPPDLDKELWTMLNTFAGDGRTTPMNTVVGFAAVDSPSGLPPAQDWMRVPYTKTADAMAFEFHEQRNLRSPAGRIYTLRSRWPAKSLGYRGWVTYETDGGSAQFFHVKGANESVAALVRVEATHKEGEYVLYNLGTLAAPLPEKERSYISFASNGLWVRCDKYGLAVAMTVQLLKVGTPLPPAPPPTPHRPRTPTPCPTKFDFRRLGLRTAGMLMSPYIPKGTVFQEPKGPYPDSQFDLSSMCSTVKHLFGIDGFRECRSSRSVVCDST